MASFTFTNMSTVYILKSLVNGSYYVGCTDNIKRRFLEHNKGLVRSTKPLKPFHIMLTQEYNTLSEARKIEFRIKKLKRKDYIDKIIQDGIIKMGT